MIRGYTYGLEITMDENAKLKSRLISGNVSGELIIFLTLDRKSGTTPWINV